jgi:hypothetical protein
MITPRLSSSQCLLVAALLGSACNNAPGIEQAAGGSGGTGFAGGNTGVAAGGHSGSGSGKGGSSGSSGGGANGSGTGGVKGGNPDTKSCSATSAMAKPLPVDIYVLLDRSMSMLESITGGGGFGGTMPMPGVPSKWDSMKEALTKFVNAPEAAGLNVGLGYFPLDGRQQCDVPSYGTPAVPIDTLPAVATPFLASVNATMPTGRTPTFPALEGAMRIAQQREAMVGRRVAIALATDGEPNVCDSTLQNVVNTAQMASGMGIYTFVIGVGPSLQNLQAIAVAGGTKMAYLVEMATADQLVAAFKAVQMQASKLVCSFAIPPPPAGQKLDPEKVNVRFDSTGGMSFDIGQVQNRTDCGPNGGWYYDNPTNPRVVNLCEASCQKVNSSGEGQISLLFGCGTVLIK